jgi:hypothetical protein
MFRFAIMTVIGLATVLFTGQAMAFQCPKLVKQIEDEIAIRFDPASQDAKVKAAQAAELHAKGNHAESEKVAKDGLKLLGK